MCDFDVNETQYQMSRSYCICFYRLSSSPKYGSFATKYVSHLRLSIWYCGRRITRSRGRMWMKTRRTHGAIVWVWGDRKWTFRTTTVTHILETTLVVMQSSTQRELRGENCLYRLSLPSACLVNPQQLLMLRIA